VNAFDLPLKEIEVVNVDGVVRLREAFPTVLQFVHMSSAYVNAFLGHTGSEIDEKMYYTDGTTASRFPNVYALSKAKVEEKLTRLNKEKGYGRLCFIRPGLATFAHRDPYPGWGSSRDGMNGVVYFVGLGIIRQIRSKHDGKVIIDLVPVDVIANVTYQLILDVLSGKADIPPPSKKKKKRRPEVKDSKSMVPPTADEIARLPYIAHATTSVVNPINVKDFMDFVCNYYREHSLRHGKLAPAVVYIDGEKRFKFKHFFKYSLPQKVLQSTTYKKLTQLDLEMHRLFGFFTTTEFLFGTRYKDIIKEFEWNSTYFNSYLENLGTQLTRDLEDWKKNSQQHQTENKDTNGPKTPSSSKTPSKRTSITGISNPREVSSTQSSVERRRSLNPDEATLSSQTNSSDSRRRSLLDQMASIVTPKKNRRGSNETKEKDNS